MVLAPKDAALPQHKVGIAQADLYLALDIVGAAHRPTRPVRPDRTAAVLNSDLFPTGEQVRDVHTQVDEAGMRAAIGAHCKEVVDVPARSIAEKFFGDYLLTNIVALGAAHQAGLLPISAASLERAIKLNGVAVTANTQRSDTADCGCTIRARSAPS